MKKVCRICSGRFRSANIRRTFLCTAAAIYALCAALPLYSQSTSKAQTAASATSAAGTAPAAATSAQSPSVAKPAYIPIEPLQTGAGSSLSMPSISMPSISAPTLSSGTGSVSGSAGSSSSRAQNSTSKSNSSASAKTSPTQTMLSLLGSISGKQDLLSQIQNMSKTGTAADTGTISGETGSLNSILSGGNESAVYKLLEKEILAQSKAQSKTQSAAQNTAQSAAQTAQSTAKTDAIIRFIVNGSNVLSTCKSVIFSQPDEDGTFLAAGERTYSDGSVKRNESFYIVFRRNDDDARSDSTAGNYTAECTVIQDFENKNSVVYQFALHTPYPARKTGNMITVLMQDGRWKAELVVSLAQQ